VSRNSNLTTLELEIFW